MYIPDRILLIDLKDWLGKVESADGAWFLNGRERGRSPIAKISENARQVAILMGKYLEDLARRTRYPKLTTPRIDGLVVLTGTSDVSGIAPTEIGSVFALDDFIRTIANTKARINRFPKADPSMRPCFRRLSERQSRGSIPILSVSPHSKIDRSGRKSLSNITEADLIVALMRSWDAFFNAWLTTRDDPDPAIGIICTYAAQAVLVRHKLRLASLSDAIRSTIKIDTVDSYQGKENRIVVLSLVRNNADGLSINGIGSIKDGFMARSNRINVAASRAMDRLVIVGARNRWRAGSPMGKLREAVDTEVASGDAELLDAAELMAALYKALQDARPVSRRLDIEEISA